VNRSKLLFLSGILFLAHVAQAVKFQIADAVEFARIINTNAVFTTNATDNALLEGPVWIPSGNYLLFCDQANNRLKKVAPPSTTATDYLVPAANTLINGTTLDARERLIAAEAGSAALRIVMITNGVVTALCSTCNGLKFYSPNDVVVKSDGTIWFTDPGYNGGVGNPPQPGFQAGYYVYRFNPTNGNASCVPAITNVLIRPNGLCFSPDESKLYVADSDNTRHNIRVYTVSPSNTLSGGTVFATITNGNPDGIRCDIDGRVWSSGGDGAYIFAKDGHLIGKIKFGAIANLCFGGPQFKTIYMTGQPVVTSLPVLVAGTPAIKTLKINSDAGNVSLSWPAPSTGFVLQESDALEAPDSWTASFLTPMPANGTNSVSIDATNNARFFRLRLN
jgi:gluconolactonase